MAPPGRSDGRGEAVAVLEDVAVLVDRRDRITSSSGSWQQIHGTVRDVQGSTLRLRADDGRQLRVDMSKVGQEIQTSLMQPSASPAPVDEKNWQKIHGKVQAVSGTTLTLKADDGRDLTVDMKDVNPAVQKALALGEGVTVAGFYRGGDTNVTARFIQPDSSK